MFYNEGIILSKHGNSGVEKVKDVAKRLNIPPSWLTAIMWVESAGTYSPSVEGSIGTGLIGFLEVTANHFGTTRAKLKQMSFVEQMEYVFKVFDFWKRTFNIEYKDGIDLYTCAFYPAALGKPDSYLIGSADGTTHIMAKNNPLFDLNKDNLVTLGEFRKFAREHVFNKISDIDLGVTTGTGGTVSTAGGGAGFFYSSFLSVVRLFLEALRKEGIVKGISITLFDGSTLNV